MQERYNPGEGWCPQMNMNTLEYFVALAEERSINRAAQKLYISQSCLTRAIQSMEKELGIWLFQRDKSGSTLTEAGRQILPEAREMLKYYRGWKKLEEMDALRRIDIYSHSVFSLLLLPDSLLRVKKNHPEVAINLISILKPENYISRDIYQPVLALTVCNGYRYEKAVAAQGNEPAVLFEGEYQCMVNARSPLAAKEAITFEDLREYIFVFTHVKGLVEGDKSSTEMFRNLFSILPPSSIMEVESLPNVISLLRKNPEAFSLALYPMLTGWDAVARGEVVHIPVRFQKNRGRACLFYAERAYRQHPALRELVEDIKASARALTDRL